MKLISSQERDPRLSAVWEARDHVYNYTFPGLARGYSTYVNILEGDNFDWRRFSKKLTVAAAIE